MTTLAPFKVQPYIGDVLFVEGANRNIIRRVCIGVQATDAAEKVCFSYPRLTKISPAHCTWKRDDAWSNHSSVFTYTAHWLHTLVPLFPVRCGSTVRLQENVVSTPVNVAPNKLKRAMIPSADERCACIPCLELHLAWVSRNNGRAVQVVSNKHRT